MEPGDDETWPEPTDTRKRKRADDDDVALDAPKRIKHEGDRLTLSNGKFCVRHHRLWDTFYADALLIMPHDSPDSPKPALLVHTFVLARMGFFRNSVLENTMEKIDNKIVIDLSTFEWSENDWTTFFAVIYMMQMATFDSESIKDTPRLVDKLYKDVKAPGSLKDWLDKVLRLYTLLDFCECLSVSAFFDRIVVKPFAKLAPSFSFEACVCSLIENGHAFASAPVCNLMFALMPYAKSDSIVNILKSSVFNPLDISDWEEEDSERNVVRLLPWVCVLFLCSAAEEICAYYKNKDVERRLATWLSHYQTVDDDKHPAIAMWMTLFGYSTVVVVPHLQECFMDLYSAIGAYPAAIVPKLVYRDVTVREAVPKVAIKALRSLGLVLDDDDAFVVDVSNRTNALYLNHVHHPPVYIGRFKLALKISDSDHYPKLGFERAVPLVLSLVHGKSDSQ